MILSLHKMNLMWPVKFTGEDIYPMSASDFFDLPPLLSLMSPKKNHLHWQEKLLPVVFIGQKKWKWMFDQKR